MAQFKQTKIFSEDLTEFDESENIVNDLVQEYAAAENESYIDHGAEEDMKEDDA